MRAYYLAAALAVGAQPSVAEAGLYADDMAKCLVGKTTEADKTTLVQWIFSAMSASPDVKPMAATTPEQHAAHNRGGAALFQRLILVDCRAETVAALEYEGPASLESSFQMLGQVAMRGLMTDPAVEREMRGFATYFDQEKLRALFREGGITAPPPPTTPPPAPPAP
jgi:hypothetical protein